MWPEARVQMLLAAAALALLGLVLVTSASVHYASAQYGNAMYFGVRHAIFLGLAVCAAFIAAQVPADLWQRLSHVALILSILVLVLVLIPGIGHVVNGSRRWISLGAFNVQPSELAKLGLLVFTADYLARCRDRMNDWRELWKPLLALAFIVVLLMLEPDMGSTVVVVLMVFAMLFVGGLAMRWVVLAGLAGAALGTVAIVFEEYRWKRMTSFLDPWQHQFDSGYQLVQSLIAFGRGEVAGVGLGSSVQKLHYLPEAHTDFVFAVAAEELGLLGVLAMAALFVMLVGALLAIARNCSRAGDAYGAFFCIGAAMLVGLQAFFNMGVNMGVLPTKGLTLPLVSYGGSSLVAMGLLLGMVWQVGGAAGAAPANNGKARARRVVAA